MKSILKSLTMVTFMLFFAAGLLNGQEVNIQLSNTYFIENATIIQKPGQIIENGSIIIKDGIIQDIGKGLKPPQDANIIKADSMYVYAGFIDSYNHIGLKKTEEKERERVDNPGNPPNDKAGIMPQRSLATVYDPSSKTIESWREAGFTASMSAPKGGMLPGQTAIILHSGKEASPAMVKEGLGILGTYQTARGMYPATIIGVMAKYRDLFRKAKFAQKHEQSYRSNPVGMARPAYDVSIKSLYPILDGNEKIYLEAHKIKDISRALTLQKELGLNLALINIKQGTMYADKLRSMNIPVVLSLDVPHSEEKKEDKKDKKEDDDKKEDKKKEDKDPETEALKAKKEAAIKAYQMQAADFAKKGIKFSFSGADIKPKDLKKNLKAIIDQGLSQDQALAALTTIPAEMYGVSNVMGSVEKGKLANLFVTNKPYFEEKSQIKYVFVEGDKHEYEVKSKKAKKGDGEAKGDYSGMYSFQIEIPGETQRGRMNIVKSGSGYDITIYTPGNNGGEDTDEVDSSKIDVDGNTFSFPLVVNDGGTDLNIKFSFDIAEGEMDGSINVAGMGAFPLSGERTGDPE